MKNFVTKANLSGGNDSGTPTKQGAKEQNSVNDELKNFVVSAGETPSVGTGDDPDTDMLSRGITIASQTAHGFQDSGAANAYILANIGTLKQPVSYVDRERLTFITANANTGASTVNVSARGVKKILLQDGITDLSGGEIKSNEFTELIYSAAADGGGGAYLYAPWSSALQISSTAEAQAGTENGKAISPLRLREGLNASGAAPVYACRAWGEFVGTGTVSTNASGNISSITDEGTGKYFANFITDMPDEFYSVVFGVDNQSANDPLAVLGRVGKPVLKTASGFRIYTGGSSGTVLDANLVNFAVFR